MGPPEARCPGLLRLMELWKEEEWDWAGLAGSGQGWWKEGVEGTAGRFQKDGQGNPARVRWAQWHLCVGLEAARKKGALPPPTPTASSIWGDKVTVEAPRPETALSAAAVVWGT